MDTTTETADVERYDIFNDVIRVEDSPFLFLAQMNSAQRQFQHFTGEIELKHSSIDTFRQNIEFNQEYCASRGINYHHVVFPAKIPTFSSLFTKIGVPISPIFSAEHLSDGVSYPIELLSPEEDFMLHDTHNTDVGKLKLTNYLLDKLELPRFDSQPIFKPLDFKGDLAKKVGLPATSIERISDFEGINYKGRVFSTAGALSGNMGQIQFSHNLNPVHKKRLLLFGDSFIHSCTPILNRLFEDVIYFRTPFIQPDIADNLSPDYILTSNAERYLVMVQSAVQKKPYFLNYFSPAFDPSKFTEKQIAAFKALFAGRYSPEYIQWKRQVKLALLNG